MNQAVIFDIGQTLVEYKKPLNWSQLYRPALEQVAVDCGYDLSEKDYLCACTVLSKYNTRRHPRKYEVSSTVIFTELLREIHRPATDIERVKRSFYTYFKNDAFIFPEVEGTLKELASRGIRLGTLSDVAYGMDNEYALGDLSDILNYIEYPYTSNDSGYRKPCVEGLLLLAGTMGVDISKVIFVGDEEKDILCAKNAGAYAVLINREKTDQQYGQDAEIHSLDELLDLFGWRQRRPIDILREAGHLMRLIP